MSNTAIIVLTHNGLEITKKCLERIVKNTDEYSLFLVDNGSTDGTAEYIKNFAKENNSVRLHLSPTNLGVIEGRNLGYAMVKDSFISPDFFCFLDNDQFVSKGWLTRHINVMKSFEADLVGYEAWLLASNFMPIKRCKHLVEPFSYVSCCGMLLTKRLCDALEVIFDPRFNPCYFEDPDICFRTIDMGFRIAWNHDESIEHLQHQTLGLSSTRKIDFSNSLKSFQSKWKNRKIPIITQQEILF